MQRKPKAKSQKIRDLRNFLFNSNALSLSLLKLKTVPAPKTAVHEQFLNLTSKIERAKKRLMHKAGPGAKLPNRRAKTISSFSTAKALLRISVARKGTPVHDLVLKFQNKVDRILQKLNKLHRTSSQTKSRTSQTAKSYIHKYRVVAYKNSSFFGDDDPPPDAIKTSVISSRQIHATSMQQAEKNVTQFMDVKSDPNRPLWLFEYIHVS